jgi:type I restriction enzyme S subunit
VSWPTVALGEVSQIVSGATPRTGEKRFWDGDVLWTTPKDISDLDTPYLDRPPRTITDEGLRSCAASLLPPNSVLLSSRAPIGLVAINRLPVATNQGFKSLVPEQDKLDSKFLYHWLKSKTSYLQSLGNGATFKEVSKAVVERIEIPLPPLPEQRRITAILDKADALRRKRKCAIELLDSLTQSIFLDMFGDPKKESMKWPVAGFSDVCKDRTSQSRKIQRSTYLDSGLLPVVDQGQNFIAGYTNETDKVTRVDRPVVVFGDHTRLVKYVDFDFVVGADGAKILIPNEKFDPLFFSVLLRLMPIPDLGYSRHMRALKKLVFPCPPLHLQLAFAERVKRLQQWAKEQLAAFDAMNILFSSLQHRAFSGQL